ncbi:MAG TPA: bleomycin resistance family protein, partial [Chloroflexota bacterium]|nr:bleomycin resistance family protein [Chloroflexota bacterium]
HPHRFGSDTARSLTPILNVSSLSDSFDWFARWGWAKLWDYEDRPGVKTFGAVGNGQCEIFLCLDYQGGRGADGVWMSVWVDDVDSVAELCAREKLDVPQPPTDEPWGVREMHLRHPDGHVFRIGRAGP